MNAQSISRLGYLIVVSSFVLLFACNGLFARGVVGIAVQSLALVLILWARCAMGLASFYPFASPRSNALVVTGPYAWLRHPIYTGLVVFVWAGACSSGRLEAIAFAVAATMGSGMRALAEESALARRFGESDEHDRREPRVVTKQSRLTLGR